MNGLIFTKQIFVAFIKIIFEDYDMFTCNQNRIIIKNVAINTSFRICVKGPYVEDEVLRASKLKLSSRFLNFECLITKKPIVWRTIVPKYLVSSLIYNVFLSLKIRKNIHMQYCF